MLVVRRVQPADLDALLQLALLAGNGMTTFKPDARRMCARIDIACAAFAGTLDRLACDYLFVLEDLEHATLAGVCAIKAAVGLQATFYNYHVGIHRHASGDRGPGLPEPTLALTHDLCGSAELCSLFLHPAYRKSTASQLLSKSRFLFLAQFSALFPPTLIAEMRGVQNADGTSPFWEHLGRQFFKMDFKSADDLCSQGHTTFIADQIPRNPLSIAALPQLARDAIGQVHQETAPARHMLEQEGMRYTGYIDIFDGGPVLLAPLAALRACRNSTVSRLTRDLSSPALATVPMLVSNIRMHDFRVLIADTGMPSERQQQALHCHDGDAVRCLPLRPG